MRKIFLFCHNLLFLYQKGPYLIFILFCLINSLFQITGVISILPLATLIFNPSLIIENVVFVNLLNKFSLDLNKDQLIFYSGLFFLLVNFFAILIRYILQIYETYININLQNKLRKKVFSKYLFSDYLYKVNIDRSEFSNLVTTGLGRILVANSIFLNLINSFLTCLFFLALFVYFDSKLILAILIILIFLYLVNILIRNKIINNSSIENIAFRNISKISSEINFAFRDIISLKLEKKILSELDKTHKLFKKISIENNLLFNLPKSLYEFIFLILLFSILIFSNKNTSFVDLSLIFYSMIKLFPLIINIYRNILKYNSIRSTLDDINNERIKLLSNLDKKNKIIIKKFYFNFKNYIHYQNLKFSYNLKKIFNYNIRINKKDWILIKGDSGCGKTTLLNILSGLLNPKTSKIIVDGKQYDNNIVSSIYGFVQQSCILFEGSIASNVTMKKKLSSKELKKLKKIYEVCGLSNIENDFKKFLNKKVNLDAPNLSGGQKQRISISRILYQQPQILILDESFNSLDIKSELKILKLIKKNFKNLTLIMVSHRKGINYSKYFNKKLRLN